MISHSEQSSDCNGIRITKDSDSRVVALLRNGKREGRDTAGSHNLIGGQAPPRTSLAASAPHPSQLPHSNLRSTTPAKLTTAAHLCVTSKQTNNMPSPSDILSDPEINKAYDDVRSDKSETTWLVLKYESATKDNLKLAGSGTGDIAEMVETFGDDEAAYGYVRMKVGNDEYSERVKFAFVVWAGESILTFASERYNGSSHVDLVPRCCRSMRDFHLVMQRC